MSSVLYKDGGSLIMVPDNVFKMVLKSWCKRETYKQLSKKYKIKDQNDLRVMYEMFSKHSKNYIQAKFEKWQVGGDDMLVVVDMRQFKPSPKSKHTVTVVAFAQLQELPLKYFVTASNGLVDNNTLQVLIRTTVLPNSVIILNDRLAHLKYDLENLEIYANVLTARILSRHNTQHQNIYKNIKTILKFIHGIYDQRDKYFEIECKILSYLLEQQYQNIYQKMLDILLIGSKTSC